MAIDPGLGLMALYVFVVGAGAAVVVWRAIGGESDGRTEQVSAETAARQNRADEETDER